MRGLTKTLSVSLCSLLTGLAQAQSISGTDCWGSFGVCTRQQGAFGRLVDFGRASRGQPPRLRIQSAVLKKATPRRRASSVSTPHSCIACVMQASHWSRSAMPIAIGQVARTQARVAEALLVQVGPAEPAAQEPVQLVARAVERSGCRLPDAGIGWFEVHQIVEAVDQRPNAGLAADAAHRPRAARSLATMRAANASTACAAGAPG